MSETRETYDHGGPETEPPRCPTCGAPASREVIDLQVPPQMIPGEPPTFIPYPKYVYTPLALDAAERAVALTSSYNVPQHPHGALGAAFATEALNADQDERMDWWRMFRTSADVIMARQVFVRGYLAGYKRAAKR